MIYLKCRKCSQEVSVGGGEVVCPVTRGHWKSFTLTHFSQGRHPKVLLVRAHPPAQDPIQASSKVVMAISTTQEQTYIQTFANLSLLSLYNDKVTGNLPTLSKACQITFKII